MTWFDFACELARYTGWPMTNMTVAALLGWFYAENTTAPNNPMANERDMPGDSAYNSAGVRAYQYPEVGLVACALTLGGPSYQGVRDAFQAQASTASILRAIKASPWSGGGYTFDPATLDTTVRERFVALANRPL